MTRTNLKNYMYIMHNTVQKSYDENGHALVKLLLCGAVKSSLLGLNVIKLLSTST